MSGSDVEKPVIVLFRHDMRLGDNRALSAASQSGKPVIPVFLLDERVSGDSRPNGGARRWWLHHSLTALDFSLQALGAPLVLKRGRTEEVIGTLIKETGADMVVWNRRYDPPGAKIDEALQAQLSHQAIATKSFEGHILHEPFAFKTKSDGPYRVYTPFWRALNSMPDPRDPLPPPRALKRWPYGPPSDKLDDWVLLPKHPDWSKGFAEVWTPGEHGALDRLHTFLDDKIGDYPEDRDRPDIEATSRLSPHLAHGEITPFQIWHATKIPMHDGARAGAEKFRQEIGWREFSYHLLCNKPKLGSENYNTAFDAFPWENRPDHLSDWKRGMTGYPIVDAGMRQLWQTGWMHNRVRMIVASFLIKHLLIDWRSGEGWFWDTLVDADAANNAAGWQWVAGSGADAAPYFRIFNPVVQGEKFDPKGDYVREFVPELAALPDKYLHQPWTAPEDTLKKAKVDLGKTYPEPIVDHQRARKQALAAFEKTR
ncbi:cryptochrome/photolyase family protein [Phyllobacterium chamaecytisi]|uniref:cryptochrome/photolyase family protein n=1 Tax=Phyllobacterium chamaecytisi TaxID=2876082 RepID=UPI001CCA024C|nr:deoxyribodipyrimidine photo-lyase [Phyllobacterium sp. KW56]MBZ9601573.1 DNA photolyase family protein [Phyllobacterium sp. KW56]